MLAATLLFLLLLQCLARRRPPRGYRLRARTTSIRRTAAKPAWVRKDILRLKALMPRAGCRALADCFNRRFADARRMTVGKTFVANLVRAHRHEIAMLRRDIKNSRPKPEPRNLVWGMDLTGKTDIHGHIHPILGM